MSYIGNTPTQQNFVAGSDQFNGTGSQTVFTLSRAINTVNDIQVVVSNVPQDPFTAYTVAGNSLTFTSAPPAGTGNIYVTYRATNVQTFIPSPLSVSTPQIVNNSVTNDKLSLSANASNVMTALNASGSAPIYAARAWVNFNGTGTVAIRASGNVSSITDGGTGDYTVNFTTAMPDANYVVNTTTQNNRCSGVAHGATLPTVSAVRSITFITNTLANSDDAYIFVSIFR